MKIDYELIDNFLPSDVLDEFRRLLIPTECTTRKKAITWEYTPNPAQIKEKDNKTSEIKYPFYFSHMVYKYTILSPLYDKILPHCELLKFKALIRIKFNMYPNTEILKEHGMHTDYEFSHKAGILSINTCDGYTKLEDGTKIDSIANRMLIFDASNLHAPSTTTDQPVRVNINFNYF